MKKTAFTHDNANNKSVDWYTPEWIFNDLGIEFDLDPCQPVEKIQWIPAKKHYHIEEDGLSKEWKGSVWLNPPYGKQTSDWLRKMHSHRDGIALLFARTDTKWFGDYCAKADAILFMKGRVKFVDGLGITSGNGAGAGSMLIAWGDYSVDALRRFCSKNGGLLVEIKLNNLINFIDEQQK